MRTYFIKMFFRKKKIIYIKIFSTTHGKRVL